MIYGIVAKAETDGIWRTFMMATRVAMHYASRNTELRQMFEKHIKPYRATSVVWATGREDINGELIYEGDIVEYNGTLYRVILSEFFVMKPIDGFGTLLLSEHKVRVVNHRWKT